MPRFLELYKAFEGIIPKMVKGGRFLAAALCFLIRLIPVSQAVMFIFYGDFS